MGIEPPPNIRDGILVERLVKTIAILYFFIGIHPAVIDSALRILRRRLESRVSCSVNLFRVCCVVTLVEHCVEWFQDKGLVLIFNRLTHFHPPKLWLSFWNLL